MAVDTRVFGRTSPAAVAQTVMNSPSLNATPAPPSPASTVENPNLANYYNALDATYEILKNEIDPSRRLKLEEFRAFSEGVILSYEESDQSVQPPAPMPVGPPPMGMTPPGQPGQPPAGGLPMGVGPAVPGQASPPPEA